VSGVDSTGHSPGNLSMRVVELRGIELKGHSQLAEVDEEAIPLPLWRQHRP